MFLFNDAEDTHTDDKYNVATSVTNSCTGCFTVFTDEIQKTLCPSLPPKILYGLHNCITDSWKDEATTSDKFTRKEVLGQCWNSSSHISHLISDGKNKHWLRTVWLGCCVEIDAVLQGRFYSFCSHHDNCNNQSSNTDEVNLIWKQLLDPIVAILQSNKQKTGKMLNLTW